MLRRSAASPPCNSVSAAITVTSRSVSTRAGVDPQRHVGRLAEFDEVFGLGVVHDHAPAEPASELRRHEQPDLAWSRAAKQAARHQDRDLVAPKRSSSSETASDRLVARPDLHRGDRERRLLDHDRRGAAGLDEPFERLAHMWKRQRVTNGGPDVLELGACGWSATWTTSPSAMSATTIRASARSGTRLTCSRSRRSRQPEYDEDAAGREPPEALRLPRHGGRRPAERVSEQGVPASEQSAITTNRQPRNAICKPRRATGRVDELRQEGEEEERDLRVQHVDHDALYVHLLRIAGAGVNPAPPRSPRRA